MLQQVFRILILFTLVCSIGPWGTLGIPHTVAPEQATAAPLEQKADEIAALPLDAQTTISAEIGQSEAGYHFVAAEDGYTVRTAASGTSVYLNAASAQIEAGDLAWDLHLQGWGYDTVQTLNAQPELAVAANRAEYRYPGLSEWYVNGPFGLQQGFTVAQPPSSGQGSQLSLALNLGELQAQVDEDRKGVVVSGPTASTKLNYSGLKAYDATHRPLTAWMETDESSHALLLQVETAGALYPITVDPLARQIKLTASQAAGENFGFSVSISSNGRTALVGAYAANVGSKLTQGAAYVFYLNKTLSLGDAPAVYEWVYQARLEYGAADDRFGISVALSDSGDIALIGADQTDWGGNADQGVAYIFTRSSGTWSYHTRLVASDGAANDKFGWSVALNADGNTALIGAHGANATSGGGTTYTDNGTAYVFTSNASNVWSQQARLDRPFGNTAALGYSVALDDAGDTALLGAFGVDWAGRDNQGFATVFQRSGSTWSYEDAFYPTTPLAGALFGRSVALSSSGVMALIGASGTTVGANAGQGAAYIFTPSGGVWTQKAMLTASDGAANDNFGVSVAVDGFNAYVGANEANVSGHADQGAVYRFTQMGAITNWPQQRKFTAQDGAAGDQFGVAIASDGSTLLIGARGANVIGNTDQGAAYTFLPGPDTNEMEAKVTACGTVNDYFGQSVALNDDGDIALIGAPAADVEGVIQQGAAFVFTRSGATWKQLARLTASDGAVSDFFGQSVALSGDGHTALVGAPWRNGTGNNQGAAYMFTHTGATWSQTNWSQLRRITSPEPVSEDYFGMSVALSDDGNTALIGAPNATVLGRAKNGYVVFFHYNPSATPEVFTGGIADELFGQAVALSGDGLTALIGRPGSTAESDLKRGNADVYKFNGHNWVKQATLHSTYGAANDGFGAQLALSDDGNVALVGVPLREVNAHADQGAAYAFTRTGSTWSSSYSLYIDTGSAGDHFGSAVALNAKGTIALIGADKTSGDGDDIGTTYSFFRSGTTWTYRKSFSPSEIDDNTLYGCAVALNDNGWTGLAGAIGDGGYGQGAAYIINNPADLKFVYVPMTKR